MDSEDFLKKIAEDYEKERPAREARWAKVPPPPPGSTRVVIDGSGGIGCLIRKLAYCRCTAASIADAIDCETNDAGKSKIMREFAAKNSLVSLAIRGFPKGTIAYVLDSVVLFESPDGYTVGQFYGDMDRLFKFDVSSRLH